MKKSELLEENAKLRAELESLKSKLPVTESDVRRIVEEELIANLSVKCNFHDFEVSRDLYYGESYIADLGGRE